MAGTWRVAKSLLVLRDQIDALYPGRNKASDGTIGDASHAAGPSDHNPDSQGVVAALDLTHDPAHGLDIVELGEKLRLSRDPRIKYVIAKDKAFEPAKFGWDWQKYSGNPNEHTNHIHISVNTHNYDDQTKWSIGGQVMKQEAAEKLVSWAYRRVTKVDPDQQQAAYWVKRIREDANKAWELLYALQPLYAELEGQIAELKKTNCTADERAFLDSLQRITR